MTSAKNVNTSLRLRSEAWNVVYRFLRQWPLMLLVSALGTAGGVYYGQRYRPTYQSTAQVRVGEELDSRTVPGQRDDAGDMGDLPDTLANAFRARILVDARLKASLAEMLKQPELAHLPELKTDKGQEELIDNIKKTLLIEAVTRRLFQMTYNARDPQLAQLVLKTLSEDGVSSVIAQRIETAKRAREFLGEEAERSRQRMLDAENQVVQFVRQHPKLLVSISATDRSKLGLQAADKLLVTTRGRPLLTPTKLADSYTSPELRPLLEKRAQFEAQISQIENAHKYDPSQQKLLEIERLQQQLMEMKAQGYTAEYPEYRRTSGEVERLQREIRDSRTRKDPKLAEDMMVLGQAKAQLAALDRQILAMRRKLTGGDAKLSADEEALNAEAMYARLFRDMESTRQAYDKLRDREMESVVSEQLIKMPGNAAARIIDPANLPTKPRGLSKKMMVALLGLLGFLSGLVIGVGRSLVDKRIFSAIDLWYATGLPVLARVPRSDRRSRRNVLPEVLSSGGDSGDRMTPTPTLPGPVDSTGKPGSSKLVELGYQVHPVPSSLPSPELVILSSPDGARAEQYRLLRCRLQERGNPRLLVVVSSQPGEGKSVVAANLALALSEGGGAKVAILDGQLLGPRLHALLVPSIEPSQSDLRQRKAEVWQVTPDLCLIPASSLGDKSSRAAVENSPAFAGLLHDLLSAFDYVIVDTPPLSLAADARLLLRHGGSGLLVVRAARTDLEMLGLALDRIGRHSVCGVILNAS